MNNVYIVTKKHNEIKKYPSFYFDFLNENSVRLTK